MLTQQEEQFIKNQYQAFLKTQELNALATARQLEEAELVDEFRINEANIARQVITDKYRDLAAPLQTEIQNLKSMV